MVMVKDNMTEEAQAETQSTQKQDSEKELNFRRQEQMFQKSLQERDQRLAEMERRMAQYAEQAKAPAPIEEDDDEPYVDKRKLKSELQSFKNSLDSEFDSKVEAKARKLIAEEKKATWLKDHSDFYDVLGHAEKFASDHPDLAEDILSMPEGFERQKLVYRNIKALKVNEPKKEEPSIQDKINANKRSPYYQPSEMGTAPYQGFTTSGHDYTPSEQKTAYEQVQALKKRMRLG